MGGDVSCGWHAVEEILAQKREHRGADGRGIGCVGCRGENIQIQGYANANKEVRDALRWKYEYEVYECSSSSSMEKTNVTKRL